MPQKRYELTYDDYAQSANTLFHFMTKSKYLVVQNYRITESGSCNNCNNHAMGGTHGENY